jgi:hypothetical protein
MKYIFHPMYIAYSSRIKCIRAVGDQEYTVERSFEEGVVIYIIRSVANSHLFWGFDSSPPCGLPARVRIVV